MASQAVWRGQPEDWPTLCEIVDRQCKETKACGERDVEFGKGNTVKRTVTCELHEFLRWNQHFLDRLAYYVTREGSEKLWRAEQDFVFEWNPTVWAWLEESDGAGRQ